MPKSHSRLIPLAYSLISAGAAIALDEGFSLLDINELVTGGREGFIACIVTGDSMRPDIQSGTMLFIDTFAQPRNGETVAVTINGQTCVKIFEQIDRTLYLVPKNTEYPKCEVKANDNLYILGVVRYALHQ